MIARLMTLGVPPSTRNAGSKSKSADEFCRANVVLADYEVGPGDRVRVHGAPIRVGFGERRVEERIATVERASAAERLWTKFAGHFEMTELYEVSFSDRTTV